MRTREIELTDTLREIGLDEKNNMKGWILQRKNKTENEKLQFEFKHLKTFYSEN